MEEFFIQKYSEQGLLSIKSPPKQSTIRFNTLKISADQALSICRSLYPHLTVSLNEIFNDVICIESLGPIERPILAKIVYVDYKCGEAVLRGSHVYSPGVLGSSENFKDNESVSVFAVENSFTKGSIIAFEMINGRVFVGNGVCRQGRKKVFSENKGLSIEMTEGLYAMPSFDMLPDDLFYPQNLGSIVASFILDPQPNEKILDMCAAPGGKSSHIACLMRDAGELHSMDKSKSRLSHLKAHTKKWGINCIQIRVKDSRKADLCFGEGYFDRVLLDAPCTGLGQRPRLCFSEANIKEAAAYQRQFLRAAYKVLKIGGRLVYSTCTVTEEENQMNIAWAIENLPLELEDQKVYIGERGGPAGKTQIFSPMVHTGFFIAQMRRVN